jgi:hypothetical protein
LVGKEVGRQRGKEQEEEKEGGEVVVVIEESRQGASQQTQSCRPEKEWQGKRKWC